MFVCCKATIFGNYRKMRVGLKGKYSELCVSALRYCKISLDQLIVVD